LAATCLASPEFELLPPAGSPRFQRWRGRLLTSAGALAVGIIGSIIATMIYAGD
jgi:hypothetical protein